MNRYKDEVRVELMAARAELEGLEDLPESEQTPEVVQAIHAAATVYFNLRDEYRRFLAPAPDCAGFEQVFASNELAPLEEIARLRQKRDALLAERTDLRARIHRAGTILTAGVRVHGSMLGARALEALRGK